MTFLETWQAGAVDALMWTVTNPATGTAWTLAELSQPGRGIYTAPNANEVARLVGNHTWDALGSYWGTNTMQRTLYVEFEGKFTDQANLDNAITFLGLTDGAADTRATNNVIGFCLLADVLCTLTDNAGVETTTTTFGETLANWNKFRIEVSSAGVKFYVNDTLKATHTTNINRGTKYFNLYLDTDAGGAATFELGKVRIWWTD
jgi:hypothetical protein